MKKFYFLMLLVCCLFKSDLIATQILVNTSNSDFSYLRDDIVSFDDKTNVVSSKKYGTFQNVKKVLHDSGELKEGQLIGSIVASDGKNYDLFAMSPAQAIDHASDLLATIKATAAVLFNPIDHGDKGVTKPNPYALVSKNAAAVDALFGSKGLNVDATIIQYFKNFYFYFEYVVKLEYAARLVAYAHQNNIDVLRFMETKTWQDLVNSLQGKAGGWASLEKKIFDASIKPDWNTIKGLIKASSWQELVTTPFWTSLDKITIQSLIKSSFWQKYVKYTITRSFVQDQQLLLSIKQVEGTIFKYIPNIEIAYYTPDFTSLRNASEMFHISLVLTDALRNRYIPQCDEWQKLSDIQKIYAASLDYKAAPFYSIASYAQEDQANVYALAAQNKIPFNVELFKQEPLLQEELLLLSMIKILHALTNDLYDSDHLELTMNVLANKSIIKPAPSIFLYAPEDYLYLEDLNLLHNSFKQTAMTPKSPMAMAIGPNGQPSTRQTAKSLFNAVFQSQKKNINPQVKVQNFFGDLWNDITDDVNDVIKAGEKFWGDLKKFGYDFVDFASDAGNAIADEAKSLGYGTAAAFLSALDPAAANALLKDAMDLQKEVAHHIDEAKTELEDTVTDIGNVADDSVEVLGSAMKGICDAVLQGQDPEICKSLKGAFASAFEFLIHTVEGDLLTFVAFSGGMVKLTADGIALIATTAAAVATGNAAYEVDLLDQFKTFGADMAVAILEPLTFQFQYFIKTLGDTLRFCQYFISVVTRLFIDATTAITLAIAGTFGEFANLFGANISPGDWAKSVDTALTEHERLIGTAITTALLLATIPLTGGASAPLIVMTVGPQIFAMYGSWQADEEANRQLKEEQDFVQSFSGFVSANSLIYQQQQNEWSAELQLKYTSELENKQRDLGFYENFLANNLEALKEQYSDALGSYWSQLLAPDASYYKMVPADLGSIYGFTTGVYELNPSQGFSLYSNARKSFSQEIAVLPAIAIQTGDQIVKQAETKNWFNQKEVVILDQPVNEVEIRFQAIYLLNSFYIGLYFGGQDINLADIKKTEKAPIDLGQLAKMAVFKREEAQGPATFGVYEHEGKGWLTPAPNAPQFKLGTWYRINMVLQGTALQGKVWEETNPGSAVSFSYTMSAPSPSQKIIGVISSGASIEYEFKKPQVTIKANSDVRPPNDKNGNEIICSLPCDFSKFEPWQLEVEREKAARINLEFLMNPTVGSTTLNAVGKMQILREQYIYNTEKTKLSVDGKATKDYVVPCKAELLGDSISVIDGSIGGQPEATSYLVSLISESLFDGDARYVNTKLSNIYDAYAKLRGPLTDDLNEKITTLRNQYSSQGSTFIFGAFNLQINKDALKNQQYIYSAPMKDAKGNIVKSKKGMPIQDYFLLTLLDSDKTKYERTAGNPGLTYADMLTHDRGTIGIVSLVSGNLYVSKDAAPVYVYAPEALLRNYQNNNDNLPDLVKNAITQATITYNEVMQPTGQSSDTPDTGSSTKKTTDKDISTKKDTTGSGKFLPLQPPASKSEQQQSQQASGDEYSFGGPS